MHPPFEALNLELAKAKTQDRYRVRRVLDSSPGVRVTVAGRELLSFCSNDYLGLAGDPRVVEAWQRGASEYGVGAGASHLVSGHTRAHHALEEALADFMQAKRALLFSTGYMANLGVVNALCSPRSRIAEDKLNHASLIDAARLTQAKLKRYRHNDTEWLATWLNENESVSLIATDSVFSMDGDVARLSSLHALARNHGAWLLVDEAHGIGVLGPQGRGAAADAAIQPKAEVIAMGTLGKAFGVFGAFVAGDTCVIETLVQRARTYVYTTALPPALAVALLASLRIVREEVWRREKLQALIAHFRNGVRALSFKVLDSATPIQPLVVGTASAALALSQALEAQGLWVPAIRPPTVPEGSARLRISFSAAHTENDVDRLLEALSNAKSK
jgi:8-amino-7-oxononanoate synthase